MLKKVVLCSAPLRASRVPVSAQSPNNASIVVLVTDQSGAVVKDANVSVTNNQTGAVREAVSGPDGSASFPALPLTGTYSVVVAKPGFGDESRNDVTLRAERDGDAEGEAARRIGEDATSRSTAPTRACAPTRRSASASTARRSTRRRFSAARSRPCRSSTPRSARARARAISSSTPPTSSPAPAAAAPRLHAGRREQRRGLGTPDDADDRAARRRAGSGGAHQRVLGRVRLDGRARDEHRDQVGHERAARRSAVPGPPGRLAGEDVFDRRFLRASRFRRCTTPKTLHGDQSR